MIIETLKHQYYILQKISETEQMEHFLCQEEAEDKRKILYDVFKIKERSLVVKLILIFTEQMSNKAFTDYCDCFSKNSELYLVFLHKSSTSLQDKLKKEDCSRAERIMIGKKIMQQILLLDMPDFLMYDILDVTQIQVSQAMDISFLYKLKEISEFEAVTIDKIQEKLSCVMELLFEYEISLQISEDIDTYLKQLKQGSYTDYVQIYQEYLHLIEKLEQNEPMLKPNTFWFRVWDKIKNIWWKIKPFLFVFVVLGVVAYLVYSILHPQPSKEEPFQFQRIGTLVIEETQEGTENLEQNDD